MPPATCKKVAGGVSESKNLMLKTTANSSNRGKAIETSSCQNVNNHLDECDDNVVDQKVDGALMYTERKVDAQKKGERVKRNPQRRG